MAADQHILFEQVREAWRDTRSYSSVVWQVAALTLAVVGLTASMLVSGTKPAYEMQVGWFLLLFVWSFVVISTYVLLWLKDRLIASVQFVMDAEEELDKLGLLLKRTTKRNATRGVSSTLEDKHGYLLSIKSIGQPASILIWFFFLGIAIDTIWFLQAEIVWGALAVSNPQIVLVILPLLCISIGFAMLAADVDLNERYKSRKPRKNRMKNLMALWAILDEERFQRFWD